ncbi:MAG: lamin tail domain-containing protein, partial [Planctomycetota bacterium]
MHRSLTQHILCWLLTLGVLVFSATLGAQVVINEVVSSADDDPGSVGEDWIEISNPGDQAVQLAGYGLSDSEDPFAWTFPNVEVPAGGHLLVVCSGDGSSSPASHWETVIDSGDEWSFIVPNSEPPAAWRQHGFDDSSWDRGDSGFGYGDGDDETQVPSGTISVYVRKTFQIDDLTTVRRVLFDIDFDDAFVAYLNGEEIARENIETSGPPRYSDTATTFTEPRLTSGEDPFRYRDDYLPFLREGDNVLAIQVHNTGSGSSDLSLLPMLTLGLSEVPTQPRGVSSLVEVPPLQTNFRISADGERILLTSAAQVLIGALNVPALPEGVSTGRFPDSTGPFRFHLDPTPGAPNDDAGFESLGSSVSFSLEGGHHENSIEVALNHDGGGSIYYTT